MKKPAMYNIIDRQTGKVVGTATSLKTALRSIDRRDNEYGGYRYTRQLIA